MDEQALKKKIQEWLTLKKEVESLEKSSLKKDGPDLNPQATQGFISGFTGQSTPAPTPSTATVNPGVASSLAGAFGKSDKWNNFSKCMKTLTASEKKLDKASLNISGTGKTSISGISLGPIGYTKPKKKKQPGYSSGFSSTSIVGGSVPAAGPAGTAGVGKSELDKSIPMKPSMSIISRMRDNKARDRQAKEQATGMSRSNKPSTLDYGSMRSEFKEKNKPTARDLPIAPKVVKSAVAIPADVSEPTIRNRTDSEHPKEINGPEVINSYKSEDTAVSGNLMMVNDIVNCLKRKKYGP